MTAANSRCNAACPCGDNKAPKAKKALSRGRARLVMVGFLGLPVGAIDTIVTGDLRPLGVGLVLIVSAFAWGSLLIEADKKAGQ